MLKVGDVVQIIDSDSLLRCLGTSAPIKGKLGVITRVYDDTELFDVCLFERPGETFPMFIDEIKICRP